MSFATFPREDENLKYKWMALADALGPKWIWLSWAKVLLKIWPCNFLSC